jgi:hypothetical protein
VFLNVFPLEQIIDCIRLLKLAPTLEKNIEIKYFQMGRLMMVFTDGDHAVGHRKSGRCVYDTSQYIQTF